MAGSEELARASRAASNFSLLVNASLNWEGSWPWVWMLTRWVLSGTRALRISCGRLKPLPPVVGPSLLLSQGLGLWSAVQVPTS